MVSLLAVPHPSHAHCAQTHAHNISIRRRPDFAWLCLATVSTAEGAPDERVVASVSTDRGVSWSAAVPLDPTATGETEYAYAAPFQGRDGRVWGLYVINSDNITALPARGAHGRPVPITRTDMLGHFKMRHSDDGGMTWSTEAWEVPVRATEITHAMILMAPC